MRSHTETTPKYRKATIITCTEEATGKSPMFLRVSSGGENFTVPGPALQDLLQHFKLLKFLKTLARELTKTQHTPVLRTTYHHLLCRSYLIVTLPHEARAVTVYQLIHLYQLTRALASCTSRFRQCVAKSSAIFITSTVAQISIIYFWIANEVEIT
jgi:hypothetical protein